MPSKLPIGSIMSSIKSPSLNTYQTPGIRAFPTAHPYVKNANGSVSNVVIMGYQPKKDGPIYAIPTMVGGKQLEPNQAIQIAEKQGLANYPQHKTSEEHNQWASTFHDKINKSGVITNKPIGMSILDILNFKR